jgi:hypothetical protein
MLSGQTDLRHRVLGKDSPAEMAGIERLRKKALSKSFSGDNPF